MSKTSESKTVQEKLADLTALVEWFQGEEFSLEEALDKYKDAEKLAAEIEADLTKLKNDIVVIKKKFDTPQ